jgi:signal recognition particle receptor subunit beta
VPNRPQYTLLGLGFGGAGKTSLLATLMQEDTADIAPTKGFSIKAAQLSGVVFNVKEVGGSEAFRKYWSRYYTDNDGLLYVLDASAARDDLGASIAALYAVLADATVGKCPTLILINKLDVPGCQPFEEVRGMIDETRLQGRRSSIVGCTITDRASISKAFEDFASSNYQGVSDIA